VKAFLSLEQGERERRRGDVNTFNLFGSNDRMLGELQCSKGLSFLVW
jgi:hypothetical protein